MDFFKRNKNKDKDLFVDYKEIDRIMKDLADKKKIKYNGVFPHTNKNASTTKNVSKYTSSTMTIYLTNSCHHCNKQINSKEPYYVINKYPGHNNNLCFHEECFLEAAGDEYKI